MSEENKLKLDLQMFAHPTTDPNTNTTGSTGLSNENKTYYHDTLIDNAEPYLVHDQFGTEINIPEHGGKTVEVRYFDVLAKNTTALTEGVTPDGSSLSMGVKNVTLAQYGDYVTLSDVVSVTTIDPMLVQATKAMGSQAGRSLDTITRNVITAGTNVLYCPKTVAGVLTPVTSRDDLNETSQLTPDIILQAQAMLEAQNTADTLYSAADIRQALEELGFTGADSGSEGETWTRRDDGYTLQVTYAQEEMEHGVMNRMQVQAADGEEVMITLPCSRYDSIQT